MFISKNREVGGYEVWRPPLDGKTFGYDMLSFIAGSDVTSWRRFETRRTLGRLVILEELGEIGFDGFETECWCQLFHAKHVDIHFC